MPKISKGQVHLQSVYKKPEERSEPLMIKKKKKSRHITDLCCIFFLCGLEAQPPRGAIQELFRLLSSIWNLRFIESLLPTITGYTPRGPSMDAFPLGLMNSFPSHPPSQMLDRTWHHFGSLYPPPPKKRMPSSLKILNFKSCFAFLQPPGRRYQTACSQIRSLEFVVQTGSLQTMKSVKHTCIYMFM